MYNIYNILCWPGRRLNLWHFTWSLPGVDKDYKTAVDVLMHTLSLKLTQHSKNTTFAKQNKNTEKIMEGNYRQN
jgi:hypothetical protein